MFPKSLVPEHKVTVLCHHAIAFNTTLSNKAIIKLLQEKKIVGYVTPDKAASGYSGPTYNDRRIEGSPDMLVNASCCAFTKVNEKFYLFPIHKMELANVGITEDHLIWWIKYLNGLKVGFKYLYLGEQPMPKELWDKMATSYRGMQDKGQRYNENMYYWVAVPKMVAPNNEYKSYLHWINLRFIFNTVSSAATTVELQKWTVKRLPYYMIPRLINILIEDHKMKPFKAYIYALTMSCWQAYYGMFYTDLDPSHIGITSHIPDASVTATEFKKVWQYRPTTSNNSMITYENRQMCRTAGIREFKGKHDYKILYALFDKGDIEGAIKYLDSIYFPKKAKTTRAKTNGKKEQNINRGSFSGS